MKTVSNLIFFEKINADTMLLSCRLIPDGKGGFVKDFGKCWKAVEDPRSGELLINFGTKGENGDEVSEGCSKSKKSKAKRTSDGACKNRQAVVQMQDFFTLQYLKGSPSLI